MRTSPNAVPDINESVELACMTSVPLVLPLSSAEPAPALATRAASARLARDADWLPRGAPSCEELGHGDTSSMPSMPAGRRLGTAACAYGSPARCHGSSGAPRPQISRRPRWLRRQRDVGRAGPGRHDIVGLHGVASRAQLWRRCPLWPLHVSIRCPPCHKRVGRAGLVSQHCRAPVRRAALPGTSFPRATSCARIGYASCLGEARARRRRAAPRGTKLRGARPW